MYAPAASSACEVSASLVLSRVALAVSRVISARPATHGECDLYQFGSVWCFLNTDVWLENFLASLSVSSVAGFCRVNSAITRGGACRAGDICEGSLACINGRCSSTFLPIGARCFPGDVCMNSMPCLNGICSSATWYTNWQRCLMDCPVYAGPCCGGPMPSSGAGQPYSTVDGCCAQSAFQGQRDACLARSRCTLKDGYVASE